MSTALDIVAWVTAIVLGLPLLIFIIAWIRALVKSDAAKALFAYIVYASALLWAVGHLFTS